MARPSGFEPARRDVAVMNAFTVAILRACRSACECEVCKLLREISRVMEESLLEGLRR